MEIIFSHTAKNNIQKLQKNDQEYIKEKILFLSKLENIFNYPKIKKLESLQFYRFRTWNFRIFFNIINWKILINNITRRDEKTYKI